MSDTPPITSTLQTELTDERVRAFIKQNTRGETAVELIAHDPLRIPKLSIYELTFTSVEDRDRFTIALRLMDYAPPATAKQRAPV